MTEFEQKLQAARGGDADAQCRVAYCYYHGEGGAPQDTAQAMHWYHAAAQSGHAAAQNYVGYCYDKGLSGMPQDAAKAYIWYTKAVDQGYGEAKTNLLSLMDGQHQKAEGGDADAQWFTAEMFLTGGEPQEAFLWYEKAALQGHPAAQAAMGEFCELGKHGAAKDPDKAADWYRKAAGQGNAVAQNNLGAMLWNGSYSSAYGKNIASPAALAEAFGLFSKAAEQGHVPAYINLAGCYLNGKGTGKNTGLARSWLKKAADAGNYQAKEALRKLDAGMSGEGFWKR